MLTQTRRSSNSPSWPRTSSLRKHSDCTAPGMVQDRRVRREQAEKERKVKTTLESWRPLQAQIQFQIFIFPFCSLRDLPISLSNQRPISYRPILLATNTRTHTPAPSDFPFPSVVSRSIRGQSARLRRATDFSKRSNCHLCFLSPALISLARTTPEDHESPSTHSLNNISTPTIINICLAYEQLILLSHINLCFSLVY